MAPPILLLAWSLLLAWAAPLAAADSTCPSICTSDESSWAGFTTDGKVNICMCKTSTSGCDCKQNNPNVYCFKFTTDTPGKVLGVLALEPQSSGGCESGLTDCRCRTSTKTPAPTTVTAAPTSSPTTESPKPTPSTASPTTSTSPGTTSPATTPVVTTDGPTASPSATPTSAPPTLAPTTTPTTTPPGSSSPSSDSNGSSLQTWQIGLIIGSGVLILGVLCTLCCLWRSNRERIERHENVEEDEEFYRENYQTNKRRSSEMHQFHPSSSNLARSATRADSAPLAPATSNYADETYSAIINGNDLYSRRGSNGSLLLTNLHNPTSPARPGMDDSNRSSLKPLHPLVDV
ncbi:hypothetical protein SPRG_02975 [Saprolegnia parasitica CBS 223.65]|uniref:Uncharacterized protein n=1 Tax=Saprolegnia parasitica (strain CBS 223.65) TaxID=695850 RepID=A0A067CPQ0_SAPPC|nr:hypothetical protein SPRG_02975 [Saprolegnia parasitica CBS 223.65]KDO32498.1 hypothetical protein SPRG_02975 [Saprolegnia parasitica CBS 223.65]|eukprot:XP_012196947.1 hypothetical protein SPRG_02975 [Saprolegnia parasitica CBS 223.65]